MKPMLRMKNAFWKQIIRSTLFIPLVIFGTVLTNSCKDDFYYDDGEPEWLGASIYDHLQSLKTYTTYIQLIDDVGYTEVLSKTGSKTLFVADDEAFNRFYQRNAWGVTGYNQLSLAQKKTILNFSMINNAYILEVLANYNAFGGLILDGAMRRATAISVLDTIPFENGNNLPSGQYWDKFRGTGMHLLKDNTSWPLVHFLESHMANVGITDDDFKIITGIERSKGDAYIFNRKVIERDITCKNGYVHVLDDVLIPPVNMAEHIRTDESTTEFSALLERFTAPHFDADETQNYKILHPDFTDSIYTKKYFASYGTIENFIYPDGTEIKDELLLPFDPGWNSYVRLGNGNAIQPDMAAMLVPTDDAMTQYFEFGSGKILKDRYGSWENVPDDIISLFLKRHMRESFVESVPSQFNKLNDSENSPIIISPSEVVESYIGINGVVYHTSEVYPPDDYVSVYGPVLFSDKTLVYNWAIRENDFRLYLNSLVSLYSFFVPTDDFFDGYIDPIAYAKDVPGALKYWYNEEDKAVNATVYNYNKSTGEIGDSINVIENAAFLRNRLLDLLDAHIVVGDVESGNQYYFTKSGNALKVNGVGSGLKIQGGGNIEIGNTVNVTDVFNQSNGNTYFIDKPIQSPLKSTYSVLSETPEFSLFFELLSGFPSSSSSVVFVKKTNYYGIDFNIKFFNTFNYTLYVPTNEAMQTALDDRIIHTWDEINALEDPALKAQYIKELERFLRYHFQDNSVFIGGDILSVEYQTATIKLDEKPTQFRTYKDKYYKVGIENNGTDILLSTENYGTAQVVKDNGLYNILVRDYVFSNNPLSYEEIDGTGSGDAFANSRITTSSTAVIHQIDKVLKFE